LIPVIPAMVSKLLSTRRRVAVAFLAAGLVTAFATAPFTEWARQEWFGREPEPGVKLVFTATAYCKGTTTASGIGVRRGIAAADPAVLPAGSVVTLSTGVTDFDGVYTVMDTGPKVKGRLLDLYVWSCHEALAFGRKAVEVTVLRLGWDPRASAATLVDRLFRRQNVRRTPKREEAPAPPSAEAQPQAPAPPEEDVPPPPDEATPSVHPAPPADASPATPPTAEAPG
jgi:3D (Asp-Asp-Asp) domain-containing protein